jgi:rhamnose utilization protein RhaD (predicted bifunctional aldolase and dehydrogenase)
VTCSLYGLSSIKELFGDRVVWVDEIKPGYSLAEKVRTIMSEYKNKQGISADILFLQNHGVFIAADTPEEIKKATNYVVDKIVGRVKSFPDFEPIAYDKEKSEAVASFLGKLLMQSGSASSISFRVNKTIYDFIKDRESFNELARPFSPDHIVYCKSEFVFVSQGKSLDELYKAMAEALEEYRTRSGFFPKVIAVEKLGVFTLGETKNDSDITADLFEDAAKIAVYSKSFGGPRYMSENLVKFICTWEVESYRKKVSLTEGQSKG